MARFFFDSSDGDGWDRDDVGLECPNIDAAQLQASWALIDLARDTLPDTAPGHVSILMRDHARRPVLRVTLALTAEALA